MSSSFTGSAPPDWRLRVTRGEQSGFFNVAQTGRNRSIEITTDPEDIWAGGGLYTGFPTGAAESAEVFSSDANDTLAGTGARTLVILGLDENFARKTVFVNMNGTTAVLLTGLWTRINQMRVIAVGSAAGNVGTLTIRHTTTTANVFISTPPGENRGSSCVWTVPAGHTAFLSIFGATLKTKNSDVEMALRARFFGGGWLSLFDFIITASQSSFIQDFPSGGVAFSEKTDIVLTAQVVTQSSDVSAILELIHYKNT